MEVGGAMGNGAGGGSGIGSGCFREFDGGGSWKSLGSSGSSEKNGRWAWKTKKTTIVLKKTIVFLNLRFNNRLIKQQTFVTMHFGAKIFPDCFIN
jgi:hypothetical protein